MVVDESDVPGLPDWDAPASPPGDRSSLPGLLLAGGAYVLLVGLLAVAASVPVALVGGALVGVAVAWWAVRRASGEGQSVLPGAVTDVPSGERLARLVEGVSGDLGIPVPRVCTYADGPVNAIVTRDRRGPVVCVSDGLVRSYGLTELEAVVTHCLVRIADGVPTPAWSRLVPGWTTRVPPCAPAGHDVRAAAVTRYPPGLASAIGKAEPRGGRDQGLWFVPRAAGECAPAARESALGDL